MNSGSSGSSGGQHRHSTSSVTGKVKGSILPTAVNTNNTTTTTTTAPLVLPVTSSSVEDVSVNTHSDGQIIVPTISERENAVKHIATNGFSKIGDPFNYDVYLLHSSIIVVDVYKYIQSYYNKYKIEKQSPIDGINIWDKHTRDLTLWIKTHPKLLISCKYAPFLQFLCELWVERHPINGSDYPIQGEILFDYENELIDVVLTDIYNQYANKLCLWFAQRLLRLQSNSTPAHTGDTNTNLVLYLQTQCMLTILERLAFESLRLRWNNNNDNGGGAGTGTGDMMLENQWLPINIIYEILRDYVVCIMTELGITCMCNKDVKIVNASGSDCKCTASNVDWALVQATDEWFLQCKQIQSIIDELLLFFEEVGLMSKGNCPTSLEDIHLYRGIWSFCDTSFQQYFAARYAAKIVQADVNMRSQSPNRNQNQNQSQSNTDKTSTSADTTATTSLYYNRSNSLWDLQLLVELEKFNPELEWLWIHISGVLNSSILTDIGTQEAVTRPTAAEREQGNLYADKWQLLLARKKQQLLIGKSLDTYYQLLLAPPRDLYGVYELKLLVRCGEEMRWNKRCTYTIDLLNYLGEWVIRISNYPEHSASYTNSRENLTRQMCEIFQLAPSAMARVRYNNKKGLINFLTYESTMPSWVEWFADVIENICRLNFIADVIDWIIEVVIQPLNARYMEIQQKYLHPVWVFFMGCLHKQKSDRQSTASVVSNTSMNGVTGIPQSAMNSKSVYFTWFASNNNQTFYQAYIDPLYTAITNESGSDNTCVLIIKTLLSMLFFPFILCIGVVYLAGYVTFWWLFVFLPL